MDLVKKMRLKTKQPLLLMHAPTECKVLFDALTITTRPGKTKPLPQIILFFESSTAMTQQLLQLESYIGHDTLLWLCYPKKASGINTDLGIMDSWKLVFDMGYRGQTSVAINDDWAALRVTNAPRKTPSQADVPMTERKDEGIDYVNRTATLPPDALTAVKKHKGMEELFYAQSFTCKKEYVMAINDAKKEETRKHRIDQLVAAMLQKMAAKSIKEKK